MDSSTPVLRDGETLVTYGKNQPEYVPLECAVSADERCIRIASEWTPTAEELSMLLNGGRIRLTLLTNGKPQPVFLEVTCQ